MNIIENSECLSDFGNFIKNGREKKGLYQREVAKQLGISQNYLSNIETGSKNLDFTLAINICHVLDLNMNDFIAKYIK